MKKIIGGLIVGLILIPLTSSATVNTLEELRAQINSLLAMVAQLQTQLAAQTGSSGAGFCSSFNMDLKIGDRGTEVARLHAALEKDGFAIPDSEKPQREGETANDTRFGEATASKVSAFQEKYRSEILTPAGLSNGTGYLGARTRAKLNALYGCNSGPTNPQLPGIWTPFITGPSSNLSYATVNQYYVANFTVAPTQSQNGKMIDYEWRVSDLPPGLQGVVNYCPPGTACTMMHNPYSFTIYGTPTKAGTYTVNIRVKRWNDAEGYGIVSNNPETKHSFMLTVNEAATNSASNLYINLDGSSPSSQTINSGSSNVNVGSFKISSQNGDTTIQNIRFGMTTYPFCPGKSYGLYDGNTLLSSVSGTDSGCNFFFNNLNYTIPTNTAKLLHVKMDISPETMSGQFAIQMKEVGTKYSSKISGLPVTANPVTIIGSTSSENIITGTTGLCTNLSRTWGETYVDIEGGSITKNGIGYVVDGANGVSAGANQTMNFYAYLPDGHSKGQISVVYPNSAEDSYIKARGILIASVSSGSNPSEPNSSYGGVIKQIDSKLAKCPSYTRTTQTVTKPDLIVGAVACEPLNPKANENNIFCQVTVWNNSPVDVAQSFDVNIQGSAITINGLKAQERKTVKNLSPFGFSVAGTHTLNFPIDIWNSVNESNESNNSHSMPITIGSAPVQAPTGVLSFYKNSFDFSYTKGDYLPPLQLLTFTNNSNVNINYNLSVPSKPSWLNASYATDTLTISPGTLTSVLATVSPENLNPGSYSTNLVISGNFVGSPIYIPINLTVK